MSRPVPTNIIIEMNKRGYKDVDILRYLKQKGYTPVEITDAFNQAKVKLELSRQGNISEEESIQTGQEEQESPAVPETRPRSEVDSSQIQIFSIKIKAIEDRQKQQVRYLETLRDQIIAKMQESNSRIKEISAQVSALQQAFSKVLAPLASNVKAKAGMLDINKVSNKNEEKFNEPEEKVVVIKETTKTIEKSKSKKKKKPGLEDQFKK